MTKLCVYRRALPGLACVCAMSGLSDVASAEDFVLSNPSFEAFPITPPEGQASPNEITLPFVPGWQETGEVSTEQGFTGLLDNGYFLNIPTVFSGFPIPAVPNAHDDGNDELPHVAYLRYNATSNGGGTPTTISQQTPASMEAFTIYRFTMSLGIGFLQQPNSTDPVNNPYTAILSIGYYTDGSTVASGFNTLASRVVNIDEMNPDTSLKDFSVYLKTDDALFVNPLVIHVQQDGGTTGSINLDHARFSSSEFGDMNGDGVLTNGDIAPFVLALTEPGDFTDSFPGIDPDVYGDMNGDGVLTNADIAGFVNALTGGVIGTVPEPGSLGLLGLGGLLLVRRRR